MGNKMVCQNTFITLEMITSIMLSLISKWKHENVYKLKNNNLHRDVDRDDVEEKNKQIKGTSQKNTNKYSHVNVNGYDV